MSPRFPVCTSKQAIRALERDGWIYRNATGSHRRFTHPTKPGTVIVPYHNRELKRGTLLSIIRTAGLTVIEFRELMA